MNSIDDDGEPTPSLYFDSLPIETMDNTTRHLAFNPNSRFWPSGLTPVDISLLHNFGGEYGRYVASRFDAMHVSSKPSSRCNENSNEIFVTGERAFNVLMAAGEKFRSIHWEDDTFPIENCLDKISTKCEKLESISFGNCTSIPHWIAEFGDRIKSLAFHCGATPDNMLVTASFCTNIRELTLKRVRSTALNGSCLWAYIGNTLEKLSLELVDEEEDELRRIRMFCSELKYIDIKAMGLPFQGLAPFLASFAEELEYARIHCMHHSKLEQVVENCTNARFDIDYGVYDFANYLGTVGKQLERVSFGWWSDGDNDLANRKPGWDACPNLQAISVYGITALTQVEAIFNSPKMFLKELTLNLDIPRIDLKKAMDSIAEGGITTLESVRFRIRQPPPGTFEKLVEMNKSLYDVRICFDWIYEKTVERGIEITKCFLRSPALEYLEVYELSSSVKGKFREIEELIYGKYRHRRVRAKIFYRRY